MLAFRRTGKGTLSRFFGAPNAWVATFNGACCCHPLVSQARAIPAVNSGRSVSDSPPRSSKLYISFETTSVVSPSERENTSVFSNTGISTRRKR